MMTNQQVLTVYAEMADLTEQMLDAATRSEWEQLVELEQRCAAHVRTLQAEEPQQPMVGAQDPRHHDAVDGPAVRHDQQYRRRAPPRQRLRRRLMRQAVAGIDLRHAPSPRRRIAPGRGKGAADSLTLPGRKP